MRRKIAYAIKTGTNPDAIGEQYIDLPRALCDLDNLPTKGQKSMATHFYQARYKGTELIAHSFPENWTADSIILEGMFLINTKPLPIHKTLAGYANFIMSRFVLPHYYKGGREVHLLFDNSGRQVENPKVFEQARRDSSLPEHTCVQFVADAVPPRKWQELLKCRRCKRGLTIFLSSYNVSPSSHFWSNEQPWYPHGSVQMYRSPPTPIITDM